MLIHQSKMLFLEIFTKSYQTVCRLEMQMNVWVVDEVELM